MTMQTILAIAAVACAGLFGALVAPRIVSYLETRRHREVNRIAGKSSTQNASSRFQSTGAAGFILKQIAQAGHMLQQRHPVRKRRSASSKNTFATRFLALHAQPAGIQSAYAQQACMEIAKRHALIGAAVGIVLGWIISVPLGLLGGISLCLLGAYSPFWAILQEEKTRMAQFERELPDFVDIVALGLKSGLSFERSLSTYSAAFDTPLARACIAMQRQWHMGLANRTDGLMQLAEEFPSKIFKQLLKETAHSLRLGTNLSAVYERTALSARNEYRLRKEENLAKAPVKMMLPISALVLPAMLLMVLGPVLLELFNTL